ncbi:MAG: hypothetical protein FJW31_24200 [Acidobacteria bacterium]|nr:hypothetical protein [Acidobacteriota bacterium]
MTRRTKVTCVLTAIWCAVTATVLGIEPSESILTVLLTIARWFIVGMAMMGYTTRRELLAWSFFYSALIFLGQAVTIRLSGWPSAAYPMFLLLRMPLNRGILMGLRLASASLGQPPPLVTDIKALLEPSPAYLTSLAIGFAGLGYPSSRETVYCFLVLFAALAAVELLGGKRVLFHRGLTAVALFIVAALIGSLLDPLRDKRDSAGATAIEARSVERATHGSLRFDFAFPPHSSKTRNGWGTVQFESMAAMPREFESAGDTYQVWVDPANH